MRRLGETVRFRRVIGIVLAGSLALSGIAACTKTKEEKAAAEAQKQEKEAAEDQRDRDKDFEGQLSRILYASRNGWTEGEITFTEAGKHYLVTSSGQIHCSAKFLLIPGPGSSSRKSDKAARFTLAEVVYESERKGTEVGKLHADFRNPDNFTKDRFTEIARKHRENQESYPTLAEMCKERKD